VPPVPAESGQRSLAGGQGVALDLEVDEELGDQADESGPDEHQPDLGGDERVEDELTGGQPDPGGDDAGADQLAIGHRRRRKLAYLGSRQVLGGEGIGR
jgi:hypothetical protein